MNKKKKIMIIGAGEFQLPIVQKAAQNHEVILVAPTISSAFEPYVAKKMLVDVRDKEKILEYAQMEQIEGVITDQTDISVRSVSYVAERMGLPGIGYETGCLFTDKSLMRKKLRELGIKQLPNKTVYSLKEAEEYYEEIKGNVIIKPLDTQGSRGVQACKSKEELCRKYREAERWSTTGGVIVERLAVGREFVVEGIAYGYSFKNLICGDTIYFDIPDAFAAKYRIFPSTADAALCKRVCELNQRIIAGFGLKQGITHSEFIMDGDDIYLIETAARGGGVFISSDLIALSTGLCTEEFLLNIALGEQSAFPDILPQQCYCGYMAFYIPNGKVVRVYGKETVQALPYVHRNQLDGLRVGYSSSGGQIDKTSRMAIIVSGETREQLMEHMEYIKSILRVEVIDGHEIKGLIWD